MKPAPAELPASDFATIAVDLRLYAEREAMGLQGLEVMVAKAAIAEDSGKDVLQRAYDETARSAASAARLSSVFARLAEHEPEVRAFIEQVLERGSKMVKLAA